MCKPTTTELPLVMDGPCRFSIRSFSDACAAWSLGWSWRASMANILRRWADKAEGVQSLVIVASGPSQITYADTLDAVTHGFNGATKYLNDLWRDRVYGSKDTESSPVLPTKAITRDDD